MKKIGAFLKARWLGILCVAWLSWATYMLIQIKDETDSCASWRQVSALEDDMRRVKSDVSSIESSVRLINSHVTSAESDVRSIKYDVSGIKSDVSDVSGIKSDLSTIKNEVTWTSGSTLRSTVERLSHR